VSRGPPVPLKPLYPVPAETAGNTRGQLDTGRCSNLRLHRTRRHEAQLRSARADGA
jgi:hypothetical protein